MYKYVEDKKFLGRMRSLCGKMMQDLCHRLKEEYGIGTNYYLVGSGARNLVLQNERNSVDLDYNLEIVKIGDYRDCKKIKESVRKAFNAVLKSYGWGDCKDSTSSLTTEKRCFEGGNQTEFSMDICIVRKDKNDNYYRLVHKKTGYSYYDEYCWEQTFNSAEIRSKVESIKKNGKWSLVREQYLKTKNNYLKQNNHNHPSFICYIEVVNNVFNSLKYKTK